MLVGVGELVKMVLFCSVLFCSVVAQRWILGGLGGWVGVSFWLDR